MPGEELVAASVTTVDGRLLLVRRRIPEGELVWSLPAGKVERGESVEQAAIRETFEEAGVEVEAVRLLGLRTHPVTGRRMAYVACEVVSDQVGGFDRREIAEVMWCGRVLAAQLVPSFFQPVQEYLDGLLE